MMLGITVPVDTVGEGGVVTTTPRTQSALFYLIVGLLVAASLALIFVHPGGDEATGTPRTITAEIGGLGRFRERSRQVDHPLTARRACWTLSSQQGLHVGRLRPHAEAPQRGRQAASCQRRRTALRAASLLRRLMDVVALPSSRGNIQDRAIAGDLLLEILLESDVVGPRAVRAPAPGNVAGAQAPAALSRARCAARRAADPRRQQGVRRRRPLPHRRAWAARRIAWPCAQRRDIGPAVASAIAESGDAVAMKALLDNTQSRLSDRSVELMVAASRDAPALPPLLIQREEVRPAHALAMFWWSGAGRAPTDPASASRPSARC